ncbi:MAG: FecR family protein, partial [Victivallaceae bacterium]
MNNNDQSFSDNDMEKVLKNHARISSDSRKRIAGCLFKKLGEKKAEAKADSPSKNGSHHIAWRIALASSIILVSGLMLFSAYDRHPEMATVVEFWNSCKIIRGSHGLVKIKVGTKLKAGDLLITGPDSGMHIQTGDGSLVSMGRCSELECSAPRGSGRHTFNLRCGSILAKVSHDAKRLFSVKTPDALLKVIGTEFEAKVSGGVPSQNKGNDKMKSSALKKAATLTALTVLTGAVAVTPSNASETVVKSGSTANITASGGTTVDPVKIQSFVKNIIKGNYEKNSSIWIDVGIGRKGLLSSIYRFNADTGKADKVADIAGWARVESQFSGGALVRITGMLLSDFTVDIKNGGCPLVNRRL